MPTPTLPEFGWTVVPHLDILAVPDAAAFAGLESALRAPVALAIPTATPAEAIDKSRELARAAVDKYFPLDTAGAILQVDLGVTGTPMLIGIVHHGRELPRSAVEVLERSLAAEIDRPVRVTTSAIPSETLLRGNDDYRFVAELSSSIEIAGRVQGLAICATRPPEPASWVPNAARDKAFAAAVQDLLSRSESSAVETGKEWSVRFTRGTCGPAVTDGGVNAAQHSDGGSEAGDATGKDSGMGPIGP